MMPDSANHHFIGPLTLIVRDLDRCVAYYQQAIGLQVLDRSGSIAHLGIGNDPLVILEEYPNANDAGRTWGLYHMALLLPSRRALASQLRHFAQAGVRMSGMSDHLVSEALYLSDPEGNGIEIYSDRPRDQWTWVNGEVDMQTIPLDVDNLMAEVPDDASGWNGMPEGTVIGHVHLRVSDLPSAAAFYRDVMGMDISTSSYPGACFLARDGYHHHVGLNIWGSAGAPPVPDGAAGLKHFEFLPVDINDWHQMKERATSAGATVLESSANSYRLKDPAGNGILVKKPE